MLKCSKHLFLASILQLRVNLSSYNACLVLALFLYYLLCNLSLNCSASIATTAIATIIDIT